MEMIRTHIERWFVRSVVGYLGGLFCELGSQSLPVGLRTALSGISALHCIHHTQPAVWRREVM